VPLALLLAGIVELNGGNRKTLNTALGVLLLLRILHVEFGLKGFNNNGFGRALGYFGTQSYMVGMAGYATYLVKGYWGF
jgi:MAPEG family